MLISMHALLTSSLLWHMYRYDVPGAGIPERLIPVQYQIAAASIFGLSILLRYASSIEKKVCIFFLTIISSSFLLILFLHMTDRLVPK
jgi:hypothetical protein